MKGKFATRNTVFAKAAPKIKNKQSTYPDASIGVCCSHKVIALGFNTLCYDAERRGIKPSARIKPVLQIYSCP